MTTAAGPPGSSTAQSRWWDSLLSRGLAIAAAAALAMGGALSLADLDTAAHWVWGSATAVILVPLAWAVAKTLLAGRVGVDVIALVAMAGALALGEYLAGAVIALMLSGGNALEDAAARRARRELRLLLDRVPTLANRREGERVVEVPVEDVAPGDVLVIRAGEVLPVDGRVSSELALVDESTLTGEPLPASRARGAEALSGSVNAGDAFELEAIRPASASQYAGLVRIVERAEAQRAPFVRMADRYAALLLPLTLAIAGLGWGLGGDAKRALAVLVVATPCPLILAAPIAFLAGISRAAARGVIVKGGAVIERLGLARTVLLDKTGTLTLGHPHVRRVISFDGVPENELLRLAASLDQLSAHVMAEGLVHDAEARGLRLDTPTGVEEQPGQGIAGTVAGRLVAVGSSSFLRSRGQADSSTPETPLAPGEARVLVGVEGRVAGAIVMADELRSDAANLVGELHALGVAHVAMVTGDQDEVARQIASAAGLDEVHAEQAPEDKLEVVRAMQADERLRPVIMVGDGVNDAPALALADVGIAMGAAGATASSETADAVITVDRIDRVADALRIGHRSLRIARESVVAGIGMSATAMVLAALGFIPPVEGALLQEAIDVAVILNALRALRG
jgi:heavy metal translocating P-type ATPase